MVRPSGAARDRFAAQLSPLCVVGLDPCLPPRLRLRGLPEGNAAADLALADREARDDVLRREARHERADLEAVVRRACLAETARGAEALALEPTFAPGYGHMRARREALPDVRLHDELAGNEALEDAAAFLPRGVRLRIGRAQPRTDGEGCERGRRAAPEQREEHPTLGAVRADREDTREARFALAAHFGAWRFAAPAVRTVG